jgi:hypothetical protein
MDKKTQTKIENLEECLAGFMLVGALNGIYIDPELTDWAQEQLKNKKRTPVQVWQEIYKK